MQGIIATAIAWPKEWYAASFIIGFLIGVPLFLWSNRWQPFLAGLLLLIAAVVSLGVIVAAP